MTTSKKISVHGIILLDKAYEVSSNKALMQVKHLYKAKKAGHAGCLDPLATGMLPLCFGEATKFSKYLLDAPKRYSVQLRLGTETTTDDLEGDVVSEKEVLVEEPQIRAALLSFLGHSEQTPSQFSAIKYNGKPLYHYARQGIEVDIAARSIFVDAIDIKGYDAAQYLLDFEVSVSKGTYIRSLVRDLGRNLGCGAVVTKLRRLTHSHFLETSMISYAQLLEMTPQERQLVLLPADTPISHWPTLSISSYEKDQLFLGRDIKPNHISQDLSSSFSSSPQSSHFRFYFEEQFIGVGISQADGYIHPHRMCPEFMVQ